MLVDVDGVLSPYAAATCPEGYREYDFFPGEEAVRLAEIHGEWLRELSASFDLTWATGWGSDADRLIAPVLGLPTCPLIEFPPAPFDPALKVPAIRSFVGERPFAWLDDELTEEAFIWAAERAIPALLIQVDPSIGLAEEHVTELKEWVANL
ncbi:MAG: HAD domain-containing protein [Actinomycetota bacterium]